MSSRKLETREHILQKMGTIKERNSRHLIEAEDMKKRWREDTEELYKKFLMTQITTMV